MGHRSAGEATSPRGSGQRGQRTPPPARLCHVGRLVATLEQRGLDGLVAYLRPNVFYLSGFAPPASASVHETNGYGAVVLSRHAPEAPVLVVAEFDLAKLREPGHAAFLVVAEGTAERLHMVMSTIFGAVRLTEASETFCSIRLRILASREPAEVPPSTTATIRRSPRCTALTRLKPDMRV